jgi:hypothetical protein
VRQGDDAPPIAIHRSGGSPTVVTPIRIFLANKNFFAGDAFSRYGIVAFIRDAKWEDMP